MPGLGFCSGCSASKYVTAQDGWVRVPGGKIQPIVLDSESILDLACYLTVCRAVTFSLFRNKPLEYGGTERHQLPSATMCKWQTYWALMGDGETARIPLLLVSFSCLAASANLFRLIVPTFLPRSCGSYSCFSSKLFGQETLRQVIMYVILQVCLHARSRKKLHRTINPFWDRICW